jgi:hypothetical protein
MNSKNIYVNQKLVYDNEISDLDIALHEEFGFDYETHDDLIIEHQGNHDTSNFPIKIETIIQELVNMKDSGATHSVIEYHCDHIGYIFNGFNIKKMTTGEITELEAFKKKQNDKQQQINELKAQLKELESTDIPKNEFNDDLPF